LTEVATQCNSGTTRESKRGPRVRIPSALTSKPLSHACAVQVMDKYLEPLVLRAGTSAAVEVPFTGSPQPKITWMVGGQVLRDVRRVRVETIHNLTTLVISRAERSDAGTYTLALENQFGTSHLTVQVTVLGTILLPSTCPLSANTWRSSPVGTCPKFGYDRVAYVGRVVFKPDLALFCKKCWPSHKLFIK